MSEAVTPLIEARGVAKRFGGAVALAGVDFELRPGEIHALLGENGAGKSTLIKIMAGVVARDAGEIRVSGRPLTAAHGAAECAAAGLAFVHQDLGLVDHLDVAENIALVSGYGRRHGLISYRSTERMAAEALAALAIEISPRALVGELEQDQKVMVAVARAFALDARAIVLDEVSSSLPAPAVRRLAQALTAARGSGVGFVYVTHRLEELYGLADRATILRDGRRVATVTAAEFDHDRIVEAIIGRQGLEELQDASRAAPPERGSVRLRVRELQGPGLHQPVSFDVAAGETVAFCGLVGCGSRTLAGLLGGAVRPTGGAVELDGRPLRLGDPSSLRRAGCTYVPGDRQAEGGVYSLTVRENLFLRRRGEPGARLRMRPQGRERRVAEELIERFRVRPSSSAEAPLWTLSGGNQQKVITGRALRTGPRMIVVDDPTAGVDVGSRAQIHRTLREAAAAGSVVIVSSSDYEEVVTQADRIFVMNHGRIDAELEREGLTPERLAQASYGSSKEEA
ncbi:MAG: sugar ABC transporter ATP-binding protein [Actinobacteria bacterium]|nr:sugar ABC transporter ATP-binding protein [Actinomycetota bacterium]